MIHKKHFILLFMLLAYVVPIAYVFFAYGGANHSVSQIICSESCQHIILLSMAVMGWFTLWYEYERGDIISMKYISLLLVGLYGLLCLDESYTLHYLFATCVFASILGFMYHHWNRGRLFTGLFLLQFAVSIAMLYCMNGDIFLPEVILIANFAVYYLCLHFMES
jgi:hypothetical protein